MHGRKFNGALCLFLGNCLALLPGCGSSHPKPPPASIPAPRKAGPFFDTRTAATVSGQVTWTGEVPQVAPFRVRYNQPPKSPPQPKLLFENPNTPVIDPVSRGVRHAVVYLRGLDPSRARAWDLPSVVVEQRLQRFLVRQGKIEGHIGFVRRGDAVAMVSRDTFFYIINY